MATLRLRDNFVGNSWETGVAPLVQKREERERAKKEKKERAKGWKWEGRQMSARNRGAATMNDSTNGNECKKDQYAIFDSIVIKISSIIH